LPDQCATMTLTQTITTARGLFAPGHLGALTRFVPFELVDDLIDLRVPKTPFMACDV